MSKKSKKHNVSKKSNIDKIKGSKRPKKSKKEEAPEATDQVNDEGGRSIIITKEQAEKIIESALQQAGSVPASFNVNATEYEYRRTQDLYDRRIYLYGEILPPEDYSDLVYGMAAANVIEAIFEINREDELSNVPVEERKPIFLFINSAGGSVTDGFAIIAAIEVSQTPVYTVNVGQWCSMAFLIGITGKKRFSLPNMTFLLHDGSSYAVGSTYKVHDRIQFDKHYEKAVIRPHVLKYTHINKKKYKKIKRKELYMLPDEALICGAIDKIVYDISEIL